MATRTTTTTSIATTTATRMTSVLLDTPAADVVEVVVETFDSLFDAIGLDDRLRKAIKVQLLPGRLYPTLVQSKALPLAISSGRDLLVKSKTGSGKTLAYCLPLLQKLLQKNSTSNNNSAAAASSSSSSSVRAVVLVPTRELCTQVAQVLQSLTTYVDEKHVKIAILSIGKIQGRGYSAKAKQEVEKQQSMLRDEPNVIVATPGGLLVHLRSGAISSLKQVETFCIDEADLVLGTFGYAHDVAEIVKSLPRICQGFLLSATLTPELESLKKIVLHSPVIIKLEQDDEQDGTLSSSSQQQHLKQFYLAVPNKKDKLLVIYVFLKLGLLQGKGLFFVNTTDAGYRLKLFLEQFHIRSAVLNAELPFSSRLNIIEQFNYGNFDYLIATDTSTDAAAANIHVVAAPPGAGGHKNDKEQLDDSGEGDHDDDHDDDDDEEIQDNDNANDNKNENKPSGAKQQQQQQSSLKKNKKKDHDAEYGVARGLDFRNVSFVVNVDFPPNARSYAHRVGRTARGGARGVALSLLVVPANAQTNASEEQYATLLAVQQDQPPLRLSSSMVTTPIMGRGGAATASTELLQAAPPGEMGGGATSAAALPPMMLGEQPQPTPLDFDLKEIEGFRYRVEDVSRAVTRIAVQEARAAELRAEILNSERLQSHFAENPADLQLLRHDRLASRGGRVLEHLKHVPKYLLPKGAQVAKLNRKRKKKRRNNKNNNSTGGARRTDNDPLQSFNAQGNAGAGAAAGAEEHGDQEQGEDDPFAEFMENDDDDDDDDNDGNNEGSAKKKQKSQDSRIFANARDGTGESTAGRNLWKEKHRKGKFSKKKRSNGKTRRGEPLGI